MAKIVTVEQMRAIERAADASGLSYDQMMENAGQAVADAILRRWPEIAGWRAVILVGPGNNGGDGLVVGYHLMQAGTQVVIYLTSERSEQDDANLARIVEGGALVVRAEEDHRWRLLRKSLESADLVVDALLGTGARPPLRGVIKEVLGLTRKTIEQRRTRPVIVAVDCPSGLDCDTGEIDDLHLAADLTVTLAAAKPGLFKFPAAEAVGALEVGDIGIPEDLEPYREVSLELATPEMVKAWLPRRPRNAHKGTFGRIVIVAGSANFPGAAGLAGMGAYRAGAGLVTLAVPTPIQSQLVALLPEATWLLLPHELGVFEEAAAEVLRRQLGHANAMLLGPGFGLEKPTREFLKALLTGDGAEGRGRLGFIHEDEGGPEVHLPPCVVDADGLKLLVDIEGWESLLPRPAVLTPHPGEFAIMTGLSIPEIQSDRVAKAREYAAKWGHVVVLKGAFSVVAEPGGRAAVVPFATPALARAGTGDVLAGAIAALRGQGLGPFEAAVLGAYLHGRAGELAADLLGTVASVLAGDVAEALAEAIAELEI